MPTVVHFFFQKKESYIVKVTFFHDQRLQSLDNTYIHTFFHNQGLQLLGNLRATPLSVMYLSRIGISPPQSVLDTCFVSFTVKAT